MGELSYTIGGDSNLVSFRSAARVPITSLKAEFLPVQEGEGDPSPDNIRPISGWQGVEVYQDNIYLPKEYQHIEYLQSSGTQYLITNIPLQAPINIEADITFMRTSDQATFCAGYETENGKIRIGGCGYYNEKMQNYFGNYNLYGTLSAGERYKLSYYAEEGYQIIKINNIKIAETAYRHANAMLPIDDTKINFYIFAEGRIKATGATEVLFKNHSKIYSLIIKNGNHEILGNFIPCRRKSDNKPGMYDTVSQTFFTNQGTGEFICGPDVGQVIPVMFPVLGKNKLPVGTITFTESKEYILEHPVQKGKYIISATITSEDTDNTQSLIQLLNQSGTVMNSIRFIRNERRNLSITVYQDVYSIRLYAARTPETSVGDECTWSEVQMKLGTEVTEYEPYNSDNTVYGGYVDIAKGELIAKYISIIKSWNEWNAPDTSSLNLQNYDFKNLILDSSEYLYGGNVPQASQYYLCNITSTYAFNNQQEFTHYYISSSGNKIWMMLPKTLDENTVIQIVGLLKHPITYKLSPIQLQTLLDQNNIWSNTNGNTEVSYAIHDSAMIRSSKKQIIVNEPYIQTASGTIANFSTDLAAPLREAKIYFEPVQEGSGDPSPENVRNISGWNSLNIYNTSKNLWGGKYATDEIITQYKTLFPNGNDIQYGEDNEGKYLSLGNGYHYDSINMSPSFKPKENTVYTIIITAKVNDASLASANLKIVYTDNNWDTVSLSESKECKVITTKSNKTVKGIYCRFLYKNTFIYYEDMFGIFEGNITINEYEPYRGQTHTIDWTNDVGTIYSGYIDLIKGELVQTHAKLIEDGSVNSDTWSFRSVSYGTYYEKPLAYLNTLQPKIAYQSGVFNYLISPLSSNEWRGAIGTNGAAANNQLRLIFPSSNFSSIQDLINYLQINPLEVVYELKDPITYQLTPTQLKTLRGTNNIWSNANGPIEVKYWTH